MKELIFSSNAFKSERNGTINQRINIRASIIYNMYQQPYLNVATYRKDAAILKHYLIMAQKG